MPGIKFDNLAGKSAPGIAPLAQSAEAVDLKSIQCQFESDKGHVKCSRCNCDECSEYGAVLYEGQRLLFCNEAVISCFDLEQMERFMGKFDDIGEQVFDMQPVPQLVPFELRHIVCTCAESVQMNKEPRFKYPQSNTTGPAPLLHSDNPYVAICRNCYKYFRWVLRTCVICKEKFTASFKHPNYCIMRPACWNCLEERTEPMCDRKTRPEPGAVSHEVCGKSHTKRWVREIDLTKTEIPDLSKMELPDFDW